MVARRLVWIVVAAALLAGIMTGGRVAAQISPERVVLTPAEGTLQTRFTFTGSGFSPGRTVFVKLILPDGTERRFRTNEGIEIVWPVQPDGNFALDFIPSQRFPDAGPGHWQALFCSVGALTCQHIDFDVHP